MKEKDYPIAETFFSVQGEGAYAGVPMYFVRFAGCPVGKSYTPDAQRTLNLESYQHRCMDWAGCGFACDTNFRQHKTLSVSQILAEVGKVPRVCLTGGEPLLHELAPLTQALAAAKKKIHIETSGTLPLRNVCGRGVTYGENLHLVVSPKHGYLLECLAAASEIKVLVGPEFDEEKFIYEFGSTPNFVKMGRVWVQPVNGLTGLNHDHVRRCIKLVCDYPSLNLSIQLHKVLGVR